MLDFSIRTCGAAFAVAIACATAGVARAADAHCASTEQARAVQKFYGENPGTMPAIAARRLKLPEAVVVSALPAAQSASASGKDFAEVWAAMTRWKEATFLIMKGANVFEIKSGIGAGKPSKTSEYWNIEYVHPLRGHLRPDQYASVYAVSLPGKDDRTARGVLVYDASGESVFGAFISGDGPPPPASELAKFDEVMKLVRSKAPVCKSG